MSRPNEADLVNELSDLYDLLEFYEGSLSLKEAFCAGIAYSQNPSTAKKMSKLLDGLLEIKNKQDAEKPRKNPSLPSDLVEKHLAFLEDVRIARQPADGPNKDAELLEDSNQLS